MPQYPARTLALTRGWSLRFRDVPEAVTQGRTRHEVLLMAPAALASAIWFYRQCGRPLPEPSAPEPGEVLISLEESDLGTTGPGALSASDLPAMPPVPAALSERDVLEAGPPLDPDTLLLPYWAEARAARDVARAAYRARVANLSIPPPWSPGPRTRMSAPVAAPKGDGSPPASSAQPAPSTDSER